MTKAPMSLLERYLLAFLLSMRKQDSKCPLIEVYNRFWADVEHPKELLNELALPRLDTMRKVYGFLQGYWGESLDDYPQPNIPIIPKTKPELPQKSLAYSLKRQYGYDWDVERMGKQELRVLIGNYKQDGSH
jgi:hypothetical protein